MHNYTDVMVDCETLGTVADAVILSIGAVKFNLATGEIDDNGFYASISIDSNIMAGRRVQEDTLIWWMQPEQQKARAVFFEPKMTLRSALVEFMDWFDNADACIWSNGADFDLPMLAHAYVQLEMSPPWKFWNSRCMRTYKALPPALKMPKLPVAHYALADAHQQTARLIEIHRAIYAKEVA